MQRLPEDDAPCAANDDVRRGEIFDEENLLRRRLGGLRLPSWFLRVCHDGDKSTRHAQADQRLTCCENTN